MVTPSEFSRIHPIERIDGTGEHVTLEAHEPERRALALRFELIEIGRLRSDCQLRRLEDGLIEVTGHLSASVVQRCVATLEPVPAVVSADFRRLFTTDDGVDGEVVDIDPDAELIEPLDGELLDLGEIVAEELALAMDPYPRMETAEPGPVPGARAPHPFDPLASLRRH